MTLAEIARIVGGEVVGDAALRITGVSGIKEARAGDLTFLANPKYASLAKDTGASAVIVGRGVCIEGKAVIQADNPSLAFARAAGLWKDASALPVKGVHVSAVVSPEADVAEAMGIGANAVIEPGACVGKGSIIGAGVYVGKNAKVGADCIIYPNVTLREEVIVGDRVIIHSGTVIGSDGFGYTKVGEEHIKIPQTGTVVIEDDVEIGACVTVDRARFDRTIIGKGTKIDNLVQIAHNVQLGKNCLVIALAGIAGSTVLEDNVIIAGQVGVAGHLRVGAGAIAMAGSGVINDVPAGATLFGYPADDHKKTWRNLAHLGKISQYVERIKALEAKVQQLEKGTGATS